MAARNVTKYVLYAFLFVLTAGAVFLAFGVLMLVTTYVFWVIVPSALVLNASTFLLLVLFGILLFVARRKRRGWLAAVSLGGISVPGLFIALMLLHPLLPHPPREQKPNQREPLPSPSGRYVLTVPIERSSSYKGPLGYGMPFWHVTISDSNETVLYRDPNEDFHGIHNVYWVWDDQDRVWLYNSDNGAEYFYERTGLTWSRSRWGGGTPGQGVQRAAPPDALYPPYVRGEPAGVVRVP
ncbi:MAG: hypothetical protein ABFE13_22010 [Phycisphaerales bacterium]